MSSRYDILYLIKIIKFQLKFFSTLIQIAKLLKICINYYDNNDDDKDDGEHENIIHNKSDSLEVVNKNSDVIIDDDNKEENNKNINDSNDDVNNDQDNIDNIVTESHIEILHTALGNFLNIIEKVQEKSNVRLHFILLFFYYIT